MNSTTAKDYLPLVQALANGETIQLREVVGGYATFKTENNPMFEFPPEHYRIKPKPLELWVNVCKRGAKFPYGSKERAEQFADETMVRIAVHMKEVE